MGLKGRMARRIGGISVVSFLVAGAMLILGLGPAWAATLTPTLVTNVDAAAWNPPSYGPAGVAYNSDYQPIYIVVDTDANNYHRHG